MREPLHEPAFNELLPTPHDTVVEIGTFKGDFVAHMLRQVNDVKRIFCVDPWGHDADMGDVSGAYQSVLRRFKAQIDAGLVTLLRMTSEEAERAWRGTAPPIDLLHVDGNHRDVLADLRRWVPHVAPTGLVVCHDYVERSWGKYVSAALREYFAFEQCYSVGWAWGKKHIKSAWFYKRAPIGEQALGARGTEVK